MDAVTTFETWSIPSPVRDSLSKQGIVTPTQIQQLTLDHSLAGSDLIGLASSGTGKTLGYSVSLISLLDKNENKDKSGLIIAPCEETATQVHNVIKKLTSKMTGRWKPVLAIDSEMADIGLQESNLRKRPRIIVATPKRLEAHINSGIAKLENVKFLVMEDTDRIYDLGLSDSIDSIVQALPTERQTMIFTSNLENDVNDISKKLTIDAKTIEAGNQPIPEVVATTEKEEPGRFDALLKGLEAHTGTTIVFCRTKFRARRLAQRLFKAGHPTDCIHSDRSQNQKNNTIKALGEGQFRVLVATDIAIGSVELESITHLVNFDVQEFPREYLELVSNKDDVLAWVNPETSEQWIALQKVIAVAAAERVAEIQKQKAIARENGELPQRPKPKKKQARPQAKHKPRQQNVQTQSGEVNGNAMPAAYDEDEDSQIFFQPSVEEQLNQLDTIIKQKVRPKTNAAYGNVNHKRTNHKKRPNTGSRGPRGNGNGNGY